jgi:hypothetical protein
MNPYEWAQSASPHRMWDRLHSRTDWPFGQISQRKYRLFACNAARAVWNSLTTAQRDGILIAERWADDDVYIPEKLTPSGKRQAAWDAWFGDKREVHSSLSMSPLAADPREGAILAYRENRVLDEVNCDIFRDMFNPFSPFRPKKDRYHLCDGWGNVYAACRNCLDTGFHGEWNGKELPCLVCRDWKEPMTPSPEAVAIARDIYDRMDFALTPVLADALEDGGCRDGEILNHLRGYWPCPVCLGTLHYHNQTASQSMQQCYNCLSPDTHWPTGYVRNVRPCVRGCWVLDHITKRD